MAFEIEYKFLLKNDGWRLNADAGKYYRQAYISVNPMSTVRLRIIEDQAFITLKGKRENISRLEYEYPIDLNEAEQMMTELCIGHPVVKRRYLVNHRDQLWEVDVFEELNQGLIIAELEVESEEQEIYLPDWVADNVSRDPRYFNAMLSQNPYSHW